MIPQALSSSWQRAFSLGYEWLEEDRELIPGLQTSLGSLALVTAY